MVRELADSLLLNKMNANAGEDELFLYPLRCRDWSLQIKLAEERNRKKSIKMYLMLIFLHDTGVFRGKK